MATRAVTAAVVAAVLATGCFGSGGEATEAELVEALVSASNREEATEAATELSVRPGCAAARKVARSEGAGSDVLRDRYIALSSAPASDAPTRANAISCLAPFDDAVAADAVVDVLMGRAPPLVRTAAAEALPAMRKSAPSVVGRLAAYGLRTEFGPRAKQVSNVLGQIGAPAVPALVPHVLASEWAVDTLVRIGAPAVGPLRARYGTGSFRARAGAATALLRLRATAPAQVEPLVDEIVSTMIDRLGEAFELHEEAIAVLAEAGRPAVDPLVDWARKNPISLSERESRIQGSAELALARIGERSARAVEALLAALRRRDYDYIADLAGFYIQLGLGEKELIAALDSEGGTSYLLELIISGNPRLDRAAREWASRNGYTVTGGHAGPGAWGQLKLGRGR